MSNDLEVIFELEVEKSEKNELDRLEIKDRYNRMLDNIMKIISVLDMNTRLETEAEFYGITLRQEIFRKFNNVKFMIGQSHPSLGEDILSGLGISKIKCDIGFFSDMSPRVEIHENIRDVDMFILQTGSNDEKYSINDYSEQLLACIDACKRSGANSITAIIPYYPNARSDKRDAPRVPIMARATTSKFENAGVDRFIIIDLHSGQIQGFGDKPIDNLYAKPLFVKFLNDNYFKGLSIKEINEKNVFVSPDAGGYKRVHAYSETMMINNITMHKERDYTKPNQVLKSILVGKQTSVVGKRCFLFDDMIDTAGTLISGAKELIEAGATEIIPVATHGVLSGPAIDRINHCDYIKELIVTNTLPQDENIKRCTKNIHVCNIAQLIAYTIICLRFGGSISKLFDMDTINY